MKPYSETNNGNIVRRTFSDNIPESELVWHRDHEDRVVLPLNENDWMVQFDNDLPTKLTVGEEYFIPKNTFHRVIKGSGELQVEIIKTDFDEVIEEGEKKAKRDACYHKVRARYDVWPSAYACVPEDTSKALTRDGWKSVNELNIGDEIMTYNIEKDELEFKPILNLHRYKDVKTNVVRSGNNGFIFEATDNHKWVVKLPEIKGARLEKYNRVNNKALIETSDLLANKNNKHLVVSAQYNGGKNIKIDKVFKYGTNWVKYILDITSEQRQSWLFSAIVYDGNQKKVERLTENTNNVDELNWLYTGPHGKQSFGFKQKDVEHRDAFLLSAFLNSGLVTWKKVKDKDIYACHYSSNKNLKNTSNFKLVKENIADVWCPETENGTWVMMQETDGNGIITITGNSGALVKCRKVGAANWGNKSNETEDIGKSARKQFKKDLQQDTDYLKFKDKENEFGVPNVTVNDPFIKKGRYTRVGKEDLDELTVYEAKKTDLSKEKSKGLHGWFERQASIDNYLSGNSGSLDERLNEERQGLFNYLKKQLPNTPEYVIKDMIYHSIKTAHNAGDIDQEYIDQFKNVKWELKTNFPITMDIFTDRTKKELESRIGGTIKKDIPNDAERLQLQRDKLKSQGISKEPIILFKTKDGKYDLAEGKHRTIEAFKMFPEGFIQPNVYIGLNAEWLSEAKKTDFSKEKSKGLHGWFERQGGKGKSKGWVDCNTCKKDPETGRKKCKSCGRKDGEERAKYPACRPTPSACGTRGKGKKWGKKTNEELKMSENFSIFEKNYIKMILQETFNQEEPLVLPAEPKVKPKESPMVQPSRRNKPFLPQRESQPDPKAEN